MTQTPSPVVAKARLLEVVRDDQTSCEEFTLTDAEVAADRALMDIVDRLPSASGEFDALELVREGRR